MTGGAARFAKISVMLPALAGLLAATLNALPAVAAEPPPPVVHDGLSAPAKAWGVAMEAGDLAALARMHDAGTVTFPPRTTSVKGVGPIMKGYADLFATYTARVTVDDAHWVEQPPLVVSWGLTTLTLHPKAGGPTVVTHTRFTDAAIRVGDHWRYVVDHASSPATK